MDKRPPDTKKTRLGDRQATRRVELVLTQPHRDGHNTSRGYSTIEGVIRQNTENPVEAKELADSEGDDVEGRDLRQGEVQLGRGCSRDEEHWPARPNESQHDWEEPRVVSKLGRATHGSACGLDPTTHRVDRLRLLGNGVVPATAEKAFRTLFAELNHDN